MFNLGSALTVNTTDTFPGTAVNLSCTAGSVLQGQFVLTCEVGQGKWTSDPPSCFKGQSACTHSFMVLSEIVEDLLPCMIIYIHSKNCIYLYWKRKLKIYVMYFI